MVDFPVAIMLMRALDLVIIAVCAAVFVMIHRKGLVRSRNQTNAGRWMIFAGIVLILGQSLIELVFKVSDPTLSYFSNPVFLPVNVPTSLHWLMTRAGFLLLAFGALYALLERRQAENLFGDDQARIIKAAQDSVLQLESRFRNLLDTTQDPVYCFAFQQPLKLPATLESLLESAKAARLIECNPHFVEVLGKTSMADSIGIPLGKLDAAGDSAAFEDVFRAFIASDYTLKDHECRYRGSDGTERALQLSLTGIIEKGHLVRIWGAQTDLREILAARSALDRRRQFQNLMAGVSSYMIMTPVDRSSEIIEHCLREVCQFIGADRSSLIWSGDDEQRGAINYRWSETPQSFWDEITVADFPVLSRTIQAGGVVRVEDVSSMPDSQSADRETLHKLGIRSFVALPLTVAASLVGVVNFASSASPKNWSDQDVLDLRVVAELFANFVSRIKSQSQLADALDELSQAKERLEAENVYLREEIHQTHGFDEIVGESEAILRTLRMVEMVAETDTPVLILGETGTGKELVARAIHQRSKRADRPLVKVNCATLPANLIESELFGYERGAFTGADTRKRGRFDLADGSTLFLDEFGELPLELQTKLLRVLQEGEFDRLGGTETVKVDVRLIAATNRDLAESVRAGTFRSDLYYRVNTFPVSIPPLRERDGDIDLLAQHFVGVYGTRMGRNYRGISSQMMQQLREYEWPGNVRELEGVIQRAAIASDGEVLELPDPLVVHSDGADTQVVSTTIADLKLVEREHIISVLEDTAWRISGPNGAATRLGLPPSTLRSKMKKFDIVKPH
ncbi:MAG: sigma 54-interacting transcriptional regulator [Pseudomonadota bacterium]